METTVNAIDAFPKLILLLNHIDFIIRFDFQLIFNFNCFFDFDFIFKQLLKFPVSNIAKKKPQNTSIFVENVTLNKFNHIYAEMISSDSYPTFVFV